MGVAGIVAIAIPSVYRAAVWGNSRCVGSRPSPGIVLMSRSLTLPLGTVCAVLLGPLPERLIQGFAS
jgi:hypothetical protein